MWPESGLVLGLEDLLDVVSDCCQQLNSRGFKTPLLFSSQALDFSATRLNNLIHSYISTLRPYASQMPVMHMAKKTTEKYKVYQEDLKFAGEHEIAWLLRWSLSRAVRVNGDSQQGPNPIGGDLPFEMRGLLDWERYEDWRGREQAFRYDPLHFDHFYHGLPPVLRDILAQIFALLMHLAANAVDSGLTPNILSALFGPLLFGLGPPSSPFEVAHSSFVRASGATEHLLVAYIRSEQARHDKLRGPFPTRLQHWTLGYPKTIISDRELDQGLPRRGVRLRRLEKAHRLVRSYSPNLMSSAQEWAADMKTRGIQWDAWDRILPPPPTAPRKKTGGPRLSESPRLPVVTERHRKRLCLASESIPLPTCTSVSSISSGFEKVSWPDETPEINLGVPLVEQEKATRQHNRLPPPSFTFNEQGRCSTLAEQSWMEFEGLGFAESLSKERLDFNVNEGAKRVSP